MRISVVIPFYNLERYVRPCLDSVLAAIRRGGAGASIEVICVDDGSADGTAALLDAAAADFTSAGACFRVIRKPNGGEGSARNAGLEAATGDWVTFLDGDDVWLGGMLSKAVAAMDRHPDADIVNFVYRPFDDGAEPPPETDGAERRYETRTRLPSDTILGVGVFPTFFRRAVFGDLRFSDLPLGADRLYVSACLARASRIVMSDACVHGYRIRANSMARAVWNRRKVQSMVDFAAGSLRNLSGKRLGRKGRNYLSYVLTKFSAKYIRRMTEERDETRGYWLRTLAGFDPSLLSFRYRLWRRWYLR